jgi:DNA uptake protein ComE-like DNA-binding protein
MKFAFRAIWPLAGILCLATGTVPASIETGKTVHNTPSPAAKTKELAALVDINSAGKAELKKLPGIGDSEADKIIAGRPYGSKAFLVTRKIIPAGVYEQIKARIIARQQP